MRDDSGLSIILSCEQRQVQCESPRKRFGTIAASRVSSRPGAERITDTMANRVIETYVSVYNAHRRHSTNGNCSPIEHELSTATDGFNLAA